MPIHDLIYLLSTSQLIVFSAIVNQLPTMMGIEANAHGSRLHTTCILCCHQTIVVYGRALKALYNSADELH